MNTHLLGSALGALITAAAVIPPEALTPEVAADPTPSPTTLGAVEIVPGNGFYWLRGYSYTPGQPPKIPPVPVGAAGVVYDATGRCVGRFEVQRFVFLDADPIQCIGIPPAPPIVYTSQGGQG